MADSRRWGKGYMWVTWLSGLLAGSDVCEWAAWYRTHFRYAKLQREDGDLDSWKIQHDNMVRARVAALRGNGYVVDVEEDNEFKLEGQRATLAGKPDIVARKGANHAIVVDEKSGKRREKDRWQVLLYMYALPRLGLMIRPLHGQIEYRDGVVDISADDYTPEVHARILTTLQVVGGSLEPNRTPSPTECRFCDIAACPSSPGSNASPPTATDTGTPDRVAADCPRPSKRFRG